MKKKYKRYKCELPLLKILSTTLNQPVPSKKLYSLGIAGAEKIEWSKPTRTKEIDPKYGRLKPGAWHEVGGHIEICCSGLHAYAKLSCDFNSEWWKDKTKAIYVVEVQGIAGHEIYSASGNCKIVARRMRLIRPATKKEVLESMRSRIGIVVNESSITIRKRAAQRLTTL